ncbi:ZIP family metal transporter [Candidatus Woesearchaeota archaeon]|jgi:zinc and cadmium transporter|nr:ZIP family metal transporter [Candidatus Woesearchaeota archaeon]MBT5740406.1 ZIP family metal transporter [Candidatus Woesearchaeota archaeon]
MNPISYAILSVILISIISVIAIIPFLRKRKISEKTLLFLVSLSAGTLFGTVFLHFLPEMGNFTLTTSLSILAGILIFFIIEKIVHFRHHHHHTHKSEIEKQTHGHAYHLAPVNIIGDGLHNFIDGVIIGTSYLINIPLGIAATVGIMLHEIPQEIADFGVLLYSGMSKKKALFFNLFSALTAIIGTILGLILATRVEGFIQIIIPFAAGGFLYIAGSNLVPELHKHCGLKESLVHLFALILGMGIMVALLFVEIH